MPRINCVIELLEQGQPVYVTNAGDLTFENGRRMAQTWADLLMVDFEHHSFDTLGLRAFMRGLVEGGPARNGHRTPCVVATLPSNARTEAEVIANAWQLRHALSTGIHGLLHTHTRSADAVRAFVEHCRYPFQTVGVGTGGLHEGERGSGGQREPAEIWGVDPARYVQIADPWPLNPEGELILGLKIEDQECLRNADKVASVPGITFAEWGPGDMGMSFGMPDSHDPPYPPEMEKARATIQTACEKAGVAFYCSWGEQGKTEEERVRHLLDLGVKIIGTGPDGEKMAEAGRRITK
jgi:4-hydroxy-2-oxoheptanedioate aldolase